MIPFGDVDGSISFMIVGRGKRVPPPESPEELLRIYVRWGGVPARETRG